ncbi:MAG TPA: MFS transporter [Acidimicrobiales bacterium]|nr:MFS transporter [Acidimicrobiales bacterium]
MKRLASLGAGASLFPLGILFSIELLDQATQSAFNVLTPNVRDAFHLTNAGILLIVAIAGAAALAFTLPIAVLADRTNRVRIALVGATVGAAFSIGLGASQTIVVAAIMLAGVSMGQAVIFPTHNSLLADYYAVPARPRIYSVHRSGVSLGAIVGVLVGAGLAALSSWRTPFFVFAVPIVIVVLVGLRLREPERGRHELLQLNEQMIASERGEPAPLADAPATADAAGAVDAASAAEPPPSLGEAWRTVWKIGVLRRIFFALPFLAASIAGFTSLASLQYQETFHLDAVHRAYLIAPIQLFDLLGLAVGAVIATRLAARDISLVFRMLAVASVVAAAFAVLFALAPSVPVAFIGNAGIDASLAVVGPGVLASLSLAIPARVRSVGFSIGALFVLPGFLVLPVVGAIGDAVGFRYGLLILVPIFVVGGLIVASAGSLIARDVQDVWTSMHTRLQMLRDRHAGRLPLLAVRALNVGYDGVEVLADVSVEVGEGEIVALVGTNGAGKSTLLRAIGGVVEADHGAIVFDGRDITHLPPDEIARLGVAQVPGGEGIFPNLRVEENLRAAAWQGRRRGERDADMIDEALTAFPVLAARRGERAANLSGGQQQMLALAMATITRPKLFLIDELSLGLSPLVVEQLLGAIESMRQAGTAILLVEQSMNVAVAVADRVYVMETGVVRFSGSAEELAAHPELLWSIYLDKASANLGRSATAATASRAAALASGTAEEAAADAPELEVGGVSVTFGGIAALDDVSLHADRGEIVGIIGPNGAGKTTLFDVVSGFLRPDTGWVRLGGLDVTEDSAAARARAGLGRSFQDSRLFAALTVREALAVSLERFTDVSDPFNAVLRLPLQVRTEAAVSHRVEELLDLFGLDRFADNLVSELSTGSRRLVDLAAVVALQPSVVLLDEPSSGVAQREVEAMVGLLRGVRDRLGATLLVVEHDIAFIAELADRLVAMDRGTVLTSGPPREVLAAAEVGEAFLGTDPLARSRSGPGASAGPATATATATATTATGTAATGTTATGSSTDTSTEVDRR